MIKNKKQCSRQLISDGTVSRRKSIRRYIIEVGKEQAALLWLWKFILLQQKEAVQH